MQELKIRRKIKFSQGIDVLEDVKVIDQEPSKKVKMFGLGVFLLSIAILLSRFWISSKNVVGWIDLTFRPCFFIGMGGALMCNNYYVNLLSRTAEHENSFGKVWSCLMALAPIISGVFLSLRPELWPFTASAIVLLGAIKDWQLSSWCKSSPEIKAAFGYWSITMVSMSLICILIGIIFKSLRINFDMVNIEDINFMIEILITFILSSYIFICAMRFYSLAGLRPIISRINLEVLRS